MIEKLKIFLLILALFACLYVVANRADVQEFKMHIKFAGGMQYIVYEARGCNRVRCYIGKAASGKDEDGNLFFVSPQYIQDFELTANEVKDINNRLNNLQDNRRLDYETDLSGVLVTIYFNDFVSSSLLETSSVDSPLFNKLYADEDVIKLMGKLMYYCVPSDCYDMEFGELMSTLYGWICRFAGNLCAGTLR